MSSASVHPGRGKLNGAGFDGPKCLSTERKLVNPDPANRSTTVSQCPLLAERHDELVLHDATAAVQAVPVADRVERMEVLGEALQLTEALRVAPGGTRTR